MLIQLKITPSSNVVTKHQPRLIKQKSAVDELLPLGQLRLEHWKRSVLNTQVTLLPQVDGRRFFIYPGYQFPIVDGLLTNFHLPKSTLLVLVSALHKDHILAAYNPAMKESYRFFSFGDAMFHKASNRKEFGSTQ